MSLEADFMSYFHASTNYDCFRSMTASHDNLCYTNFTHASQARHDSKK